MYIDRNKVFEEDRNKSSTNLVILCLKSGEVFH